MKKTRFTVKQIFAILKSQEAGATVADTCRTYGITPATFYNWRNKYAGMELPMLVDLKDTKTENAKLKKLLADAMLDIDILKENNAKKW